MVISTTKLLTQSYQKYHLLICLYVYFVFGAHTWRHIEQGQYLFSILCRLFLFSNWIYVTPIAFFPVSTVRLFMIFHIDGQQCFWSMVASLGGFIRFSFGMIAGRNILKILLMLPLWKQKGLLMLSFWSVANIPFHTTVHNYRIVSTYAVRLPDSLQIGEGISCFPLPCFDFLFCVTICCYNASKIFFRRQHCNPIIFIVC